MEEKLLLVRLSHNPASGNFFVDFWDELPAVDGKYIVSIKLEQNKAEAISRELGVKIMEQ